MAMNDDYLSCKSYEGHDADPKNEGFVLFQDKKTEKYYFAYQGPVLLRSEGYTDTASRGKGITSVKKNMGKADKLSVLEEGGKFYIVLKAANGQEVARSCDFKTRAAAEKGLAKWDTAKPAKASKPAKAKAAPKPADVTFLAHLKNFLEVHEYLDRPRIWDSYGITGYVKFQAHDGKHYFGVYNPDATLYLRSEGFESEEERDSAFDLMDSIILLEENYKIENLNGRYYAVLFEENDVVAISPDFNSFIEAFVTTPGGRPRDIQGTMF